LQSRLNFSRDMEREADRIGFNLMQPAGYAPEGFVGMFNKLAQASRLTDNGSFPYLRSHPLTTERISDMGLRVQELNRSSPALPAKANLDLHRLMAARARVLSDLSVDALKRHTNKASSPSPNSPKPDLTTLYAGALAAWQLKDAPLASLIYQRLQAAVSQSQPSASVRDAVRWLGADLQLPVPLNLQSDTRSDVLYAAQALLRSGQQPSIQAAISRLQAWLSVYPSDGDAWAMQSNLQLAINQRLRGAMSAAEAKNAYLDDSAALAGYLAAQNLIRQGIPADSIDAAIVENSA
jgi:predicted Zn-dependent protease